MEKTVSKRSLVIITLVSILLTASSTLMVTSYVQSQAISNPGTTYGPGDVDAYSYIIYREGSTYYAKNGTTRAIDYSGTNASEVINDCIDAMTVGESLSIVSNITLTNTIIVDKNDVAIYFSGIITITDDIVAIQILGRNGGNGRTVELHNPKIALNGYNGTGIEIVSSWNNIIYNPHIYQPNTSCHGTGIALLVKEDGAGGCYFNSIYKAQIWDTDYGIILEDRSPSGLVGVNENTFYHLTLAHMQVTAVHLGGAATNTFSYLGMESCAATMTGIYLGKRPNNPSKVSHGNTFISAVDTDRVGGGGSGNSCYIEHGCYHNMFFGGGLPYVFDNATISSNSFYSVRYYQTENAGTATVINGTTSVYVEHGLDREPFQKHFTLHATENIGSATKYWLDSNNATHFRIKVDQDPAKDVTFVWTVDINRGGY